MERASAMVPSVCKTYFRKLVLPIRAASCAPQLDERSKLPDRRGAETACAWRVRPCYSHATKQGNELAASWGANPETKDRRQV